MGTQDELPTRESSDLPSQHSSEPVEEQLHPTSPPEVSSGTPQVPETVPTSSPEPEPVQQAATTEAKSGSFLGSLFPWGRGEKPAPADSKSTPSTQPTNQDEALKSTNQDGASKSNNQGDSSRSREKMVGLESDLHSNSVDSGIDFVPGASGDVGNIPVQRPEPLSSSTPNAPRGIGWFIY